jgi:hypothetical protein
MPEGSSNRWWRNPFIIVPAAVAILTAIIGGSLPALLQSGNGSPPVPSSSTSRGAAPLVNGSSPSPSAYSSTASSGQATPEPHSSGSSPSEQYLAGLTPVSNYGISETGDAAINGTNYLNSVILDMNFGSTSVAYNLERQWLILKATVGLRDDSTQKDEYEFQVLADGRPIYSHLFSLGQSQHIRLNIAGVLRLELRAKLVGDYYGEAYGVWGNADLSR